MRNKYQVRKTRFCSLCEKCGNSIECRSLNPNRCKNFCVGIDSNFDASVQALKKIDDI